MESSTDRAFGTMLRAYRMAAGLTQEALARRAGVSPRNIRALESGTNQPQAGTLERLLMALGLEGPDRAALITAGHPAPRRRAPAASAPPLARDVPAPLTTLPAPLTTLPAPLTTLPAPLTTLLGREREVAAIAASVCRPEVRLLTLTGPGGVGKTRLALQVAAALRDTVADGVAVVALAALRDPALVLPAIARVLGVTIGRAQTAEERLVAYLHGRQVLLVLDNVEQVAAAGPALAALLAACPRVKTLVTSRATLRVRGEREVVVPPLELPDPERLTDLAALGRIASVALLLERAQAVRPGLRLTVENAAAVAAICIRLDGLPLALELAAARLQLLSPQALLARLDHRLTALVGGARDLPARQQTLRDTLAWSHDLLAADERVLFRRLGVFAGGCTLEAVEAVQAGANGDGAPHDVVPALTALREKSLVRLDEHLDGVPRITMLETIREFALEQLEGSGEAAATRRAHACYYLALAEATGVEPRGPAHRGLMAADQAAGTPRAAPSPSTDAAGGTLGEERPAAWLQRLDVEHDNVRAALHWFVDSGDHQRAMRLAGALWWFWAARGYYNEGRYWLDVVRQAGDDQAPDRLSAGILFRAACLASIQGAYACASRLFEESASHYRAVGDDTGVAVVRVYRGRTAWFQGAYARAQRLEEESLDYFRRKGDRPHIALALLSLGDVAYDRGDLTRATTLLVEARALFEEMGNAEDVAWATKCLGNVAAAQGQVAEATALLKGALARFEALPLALGVAETLLGLARVAQRRSDRAQAAMLYRRSLALHVEHGDRRQIAESLEGLADVVIQEGDPEQAARLLGAAAALRAASALPPLPPIHQAAYERTAAFVRATLGEPAFAAAWAIGERLPLEQTIASVG